MDIDVRGDTDESFEKESDYSVDVAAEHDVSRPLGFRRHGREVPVARAHVVQGFLKNVCCWFSWQQSEFAVE